jgi:outer membrane lipoprotein-sorting protein
MSGSFDLIGAFFTDPATRYVIRDGGAEAVGEFSTRAVTLTPKAGVSANFSRAKVWIDTDNGLLRQFESVEHNGITRLVRITSFTRNAPVAASAFRFKVPRGVKVVDGSAL